MDDQKNPSDMPADDSGSSPQTGNTTPAVPPVTPPAAGTDAEPGSEEEQVKKPDAWEGEESETEDAEPAMVNEEKEEETDQVE